MLVTEAADTPFSVISPQRRLPSGQALYKLFSRAPLGAELHRLFSNATKVIGALMKTAGPAAASRCAPSRCSGMDVTTAFPMASSAGLHSRMLGCIRGCIRVCR